jgi:broad specificity phosphatase PhoE
VYQLAGVSAVRHGGAGSSPLRLYFVRHGESEANLSWEFSNRSARHPLTETGRRQSHELAERLRHVSVNVIYSSPVMRAVQTAEILSSELRMPFIVKDALREFDVGVLEGKSDRASWDAYSAVVESWLKHGEWDRCIEGGESFNDIRRRFLPFARGLLRRRTGGAVMVGHGGTYRCMLPLVFKNIDFTFAEEHVLGNTDLVVGGLESRVPVCLSWGDVTLLT